MRWTRAALMAVAVLAAAPATAGVERDRASVGGYFRIMSRPDLQGGNGSLGYWNLYGRLLNEGPWAALELELALLQPDPGSASVWSSAHFKLEGGSVLGADPTGGALEAFRFTQLYVRAGNVLLRDVVWQLGTLDSWMGDLGLYDMKPAQIFFGVVGLSANWRSEHVDVLVGVGDGGFFLRGLRYSPVLTAGGLVRLRIVPGLELGGGGQVSHEPRVDGNRFAPHTTPEVDYEDFVRGEVVERFLEDNPGSEDFFYRDRPPAPSSSTSYKAVGYLGFGDLGPLKWNNLFVNYLRVHPESFYEESFAGRDYTIFISDLTDDRYQVNLGNEMQLELWPRRLDLVWAALYGRHWDRDNELAATETAREFYSAVLRLQVYFTPTVHLLLESSLARERSLNGNLYRLFYDSIFTSTDGRADSRGLELGDTDVRDTWQLKVGPVFNPTGYGIFSRPSLRLLFGLQRSNVHAAFGNTLVDSLDEYNDLGIETRNRHQHAVIALEAEAWF